MFLDNSDDRFNPLNTSSPYYDSANNITKISTFQTDQDLSNMMDQQKFCLEDLFKAIQNPLVDKVQTQV